MNIHDLGAARADDNPDFSPLRLPSFSKADFISRLSTYGKLERAAAEVVFSRIVGGISDLLLSSGHVTIIGFGSLELKQVKARAGRNPATAENILIDPYIKVKFLPGTALRKAIAGEHGAAGLDLDTRFSKFGYCIELYTPNGSGSNAVLRRVESKGRANESDLLELLSCRGFYSQRNARRAVDIFKAIVLSELAAGNSVKISDFGTFSPIERRERFVRNPFTGEAMRIGRGRRVRFKISKTLREDIQAWEPE